MDKGPGVYIPDSRALDNVLAAAPRHGFRPDHVAYFLHTVSVKQYMGDVDEAGFARLDSRILRRWIQPRALTPMMKYLTERRVVATAPYSCGHFATGYQIASEFDGPPRRMVLTYPPLAEKLAEYRRKYKTITANGNMQPILERRRPLLDQQAAALAALSLPAGPGELVEMTPGTDRNHVLYVAQTIRHHDDDGLTLDGFGWRLHSLVTRTSAGVRPLLLLGGRPVAEVDVANSQPLLLGLLANYTTYKADAPHIRQLHHIMEGAPPGPSPSGVGCFFSGLGLLEPDAHNFLEAAEGGELYDLLAQDCGLDRDQAKHELFRDVLFGKPYVTGRVTRAFGRRWPSLLEALRRAKLAHGYKIIAQALQRAESVIMLDGIGNRLLRELPGVRFLTIHDSAVLVADHAAAVRQIMQDEFSGWGVRATIRIKSASPGLPPIPGRDLYVPGQLRPATPDAAGAEKKI